MATQLINPLALYDPNSPSGLLPVPRMDDSSTGLTLLRSLPAPQMPNVVPSSPIRDASQSSALSASAPSLLGPQDDSSAPSGIQAVRSGMLANPLMRGSDSGLTPLASSSAGIQGVRAGMLANPMMSDPSAGSTPIASGPQPLTVPGASTSPSGPQPFAVPAARALDSVAQNTTAQTLQDQARRDYLIKSGSGIDQITHPVDASGNPVTGQHISLLRRVGGVAARIGDVLESSLAPGAAVVTPGTTFHHNMMVNQATGRLNDDLQNQQSTASTQLLDAQPQLKQSALDLQTAKLDAQQQHQSDTLDLNQQRLAAQQQHQHDAWVANLAKAGLSPDETDPTGQRVRPQKYEEMSLPLQAAEDLKHAQQQEKDAQAAMDKAKNDPSSPAFRAAQQGRDTARMNAVTAMGRLGVSQEMLAFDQDKFYNPQPTAQERGKGDLAQSALERVQEMRQVLATAPQKFGPGPGRYTNMQAFLGSQDPAAQRYLSAAQYLADHSAAVFGGRSQYIMQQLHSLTDPHSNPAALNAALDEAENAARGFVAAGKVHGKGGTSGYSAPPPPSSGGAIPAEAAAQLQEGVVHTFGNGQQWTKQNGQAVRVK